MKRRDSDTETFSRWCAETGSMLLLLDALRSGRCVADRIVRGCLGIAPGTITSVTSTPYTWNAKAPVAVVATRLYDRASRVLFATPSGLLPTLTTSRPDIAFDRYVVALPEPGTTLGGWEERNDYHVPTPPGEYGGSFIVEWEELHEILDDIVVELPVRLGRLVRSHRGWITTLPRGDTDDDHR